MCPARAKHRAPEVDDGGVILLLVAFARMAKLVGLQELGTVCGSIGHLAVGDGKRAGDLWLEYREESVLGSGVCAVRCAVLGDGDEAQRLAKGMGRAVGQSLTGGGVLRDVPVLHELAVCGESLGDMIGGGDHESAARRWTEDYTETSVLGNATLLATETDEQTRHRRSGNLKKAGTKAAISLAATGAALGIGAATAGVGVGAAFAIGSVTGGVTCGAVTAANEAVSYGTVDKGDVAGAIFMGAAVGGATEMPALRETPAERVRVAHEAWEAEEEVKSIYTAAALKRVLGNKGQPEAPRTAAAAFASNGVDLTSLPWLSLAE